VSTLEEPGESHSPSLLSRYATKGALIYYALLLPAIIAEVVFSIAITSTPGDLLTTAGSSGGMIIVVGVVVVELLPWILLAGSIYAVFSFRPSLLVTFLIASFFIAASVANGIFFLGTLLNLGGMVILVVAATILALTGFNYSRGLKLLAGRRPNIVSSGPIGYNVLGIALELVIPLAVALALVVLVETVVGALAVQAVRLPPPLSTLASLYLQTRIGIIFTTLFVAGATIWVMRQFLEPLILNFTLNAADAKKELLAEIRPTTKGVYKISRYRPSSGLAWGVLTVTYCAGLIVALAILIPHGPFFRDILATLKLGSPSSTPLETLIQDKINGELVSADRLFAQSEEYIREVITILWG
jgi:hypothetical protein